jgi:hypothetical protein
VYIVIFGLKDLCLHIGGESVYFVESPDFLLRRPIYAFVLDSCLLLG